MVVLGVILLLVGLGVAMPAGSTPGSIARRNIPMGMQGMQGIHRTPGHQEPSTPFRWKSIALRLALGLTMMALGVYCISTVG